MYSYTSEKVTNSITRIFSAGGEQMYLVCGEKKAALIDSGVGVGNLKEYVSSLTSLPVIVLVTHGHGDHALGAQQFEEAYMSHKDFGTYRARCRKELVGGYLKKYATPLHGEDFEVPPIPEPDYFKDLKDGDLFELGGITLESVACGGHSPGSMMILLREPRILITGDACNYFTMLQGDTCLGLSAYETNLQSARDRLADRFDRILICHGNVTMPNTLLDEVLQVIREIKAGTDDKIPFGHLDSTGLVAKAYGPRGGSSFLRKDGKYGNVVYNPLRITE